MACHRRIGALIDPGWLFVIAGLAICAAVILIPAQTDLDSLRRQLDELQRKDSVISARLRAHSAFLDDLDRGDPQLVRRLAASQLNLVPEGHKPLLLSTSPRICVADWIDSTVEEIPASRTRPRESTLSRLATGRHSLWLLGGSVLCLFIGVILGPSRLRADAAVERPRHHVTGPATVRSKAGRTGSGFPPAPALFTSTAERAGAGRAAEPDSEEGLAPGSPARECGHFHTETARRPPMPAGPVAAATAAPFSVESVEDEVDVLDEDEVEPAPQSSSADEPEPPADDLRTRRHPGDTERKVGDQPDEPGPTDAGADDGGDILADAADDRAEDADVGEPPDACDKGGECEYEHTGDVPDEAEEAEAPEDNRSANDPSEAEDANSTAEDEDDYEYEYEYVYVEVDEEVEEEGNEAEEAGGCCAEGSEQYRETLFDLDVD